MRWIGGFYSIVNLSYLKNFFLEGNTMTKDCIVYLCYIASIALQVSGALLLVWYATSAKRENVIRRFFGNGIVTNDSETNEIVYDEEAFFQEYKITYISKWSFIYILAGYVLGVFGKLPNDSINCKLKAIILIIALLVLVMFLTNKLIELYIIKKNKASRIRTR